MEARRRRVASTSDCGKQINPTRASYRRPCPLSKEKAQENHRRFPLIRALGHVPLRLALPSLRLEFLLWMTFWEGDCPCRVAC
jgi:hypothetical protein